MPKREYPFTAWVLGGTFIPKQVTLVKSCGIWSREGYHRSESGKVYRGDELFNTREALIQRGHERLAEQEAKMEKARGVIAKKRANLEKHS